MIRRLFLTRLLCIGIGTLTGVPAAWATTSTLDLVAPIAEYKVYVMHQSRNLITDTKAFVSAIKAGDMAQAKALYATTRASYEKIEPIAELFSDLDSAIDSRADAHELAEKSPDFGGFHRIEYGLWVEQSTDNLGPVADKLLDDVAALQRRLVTLIFPPEKVVGGAAVLMEEVAATKISGEENRYSHTDLSDFQANFEGAFKIVELFRPLLVKHNKTFVKKADANFKTVFETLKKYQTNHGQFEPYNKLTAADRQLLAGRVNTLAEDLSQLRGMLGLN